MVFANIPLMAAPLTHLMGHFPQLRLSPAAILIPYALFLLAVVARDRILEGRIRPLTAVVAITMFAVMPLQAVIGPSEAWHRLALWLSQ
jgi:hypothetical protein